MTPEERRARIALRTAPRVSRFDDVTLPALPDVPGMTGDREGKYLYWLVREGYAGLGAVVELGAFLGRSSVHLGAGLRDAGFPRALHCFDRFEWIPEHGAKSPFELPRGADTLGLFLEHVLPVYPHVRATKTEIADLSWDEGPVEILFLDAPKRLPEVVRSLQVFGPHLLAGESTVVLQDFLLPTAYALPLVFGALSEAFEPCHVVRKTSTLAFTVKTPVQVDPEELDFMRWPLPRAEAVWQGLAERIPSREERLRLGPGFCIYLWRRGEREAACRRMASLEFTSLMERQWARWAEGRRYDDFPGLFQARGIRPQGAGRWRRRARRALATLAHPSRWLR